MQIRIVPMTLSVALAIHLAGCDRKDPAPPGNTVRPLVTGSAEAPAVGTVSPEPTATAGPIPGHAGAPATPSASRDIDTVTTAWAHAVETRDWTLAQAYWGEHGTRSEQSPTAFAAQWDKLKAPRVTFGPSEVEGGAGSLYYDVPVVIDDGARRLTGHMVWRRVNDVDGATPEQLRWHIEQSTLAP